MTDLAAMTKDGILSALDDTTWDLGNEVLYELCRKHPTHHRPDEIIAKVWLIGRSYAAAIERRRELGFHLGDAFYTEVVAPTFVAEQVDAWFEQLRCERTDRRNAALHLHNQVLGLFEEISKIKKHSLASKYLHFHFPDDFFIFDTFADRAVRVALRNFGQRQLPAIREAVDPVYSRFFARCECLRDQIRDLIGRELTPRELDKVLLALEPGTAVS